jgi:hypothetical protein
VLPALCNRLYTFTHSIEPKSGELANWQKKTGELANWQKKTGELANW